MRDLAGKVAVVTGAASGIGRALASRFASEGMKVALADHDAPALDRAAGELAASGATVLAVPTDVSQGDQVAALAARTRTAFGAVHVVCNNAGVGGPGGLLWTFSENDWAWVLGVNLWGVIHGIRAFVPLLLEHGDEAHIVNTSSTSGLSTPAFLGPYVAGKHAVVAISEVLARDLQAIGSKVGVSVLCPSYVRTNIVDSEKHRPAHLENPAAPPGPVQQQMEERMRSVVSAGKSPEEVADQVLAAIRAGRFYVLPQRNLAAKMVRERIAEIFQDGVPKFDPDQFLPGGYA